MQLSLYSLYTTIYSLYTTVTILSLYEVSLHIYSKDGQLDASPLSVLKLSKVMDGHKDVAIQGLKIKFNSFLYPIERLCCKELPFYHTFSALLAPVPWHLPTYLPFLWLLYPT